jgi:flavin reductase (DIM6/NTAB) family NADH-FMN oxidoreductase RutF
MLSFSPGPDNARALRNAFGRFATGVTIVTATTPSGPVGITVNSFSSVSLEPALVLWAPDRNSRRFADFCDARHYAIHVLAADQDALCHDVSRDKFAVSQYIEAHNTANVPLLGGCLARFECEKVNAIDAGDHLLVIGQVDTVTMRDGDALTFFAGSFRRMNAA